MTIDLQADAREIYSYLVDRVRKFDPATNAGPGDGGSPISQIDFGYQYDQAGWVSLIFDTRPDAEPDGSWNSFIEENMFERPKWQEALELLETQPVEIVLPDGSRRVLPPEFPEEEYCAIFGDLLKNILLKARDEGVFNSLPKAEHCQFGVEEHDGRYGWPNYENRGQENMA